LAGFAAFGVVGCGGGVDWALPLTATRTTDASRKARPER
jgi:hypothetical protein